MTTRIGNILRSVVARLALLFPLAFLSPTSAYAIPWDDRDLATAQIAMCFGAYTHLAHQYQIADRPGAATNSLARAATAMTTNVFLNRDGERIPGERLSLMSSAQEYARQFYDENIQQVVDTAAECDGKLPSMVSQMRNEPPLFGKTFPEFSAEQLKKMKEQLGL